MIRSKQIGLALMVLTAFGSVTFSAGGAAAQDQAAIDKLVQMNKKALEDYDTLEWDSAKKTLLDALMAGKKSGLETHPIAARTYVHLGAVYITGFKNRDKALQSFTRALEIDPEIQLSKGIATSEVNDVFSEAQRRAKGGGAVGGAGEESTPPASGSRRRRPVMDSDAGGGGGSKPARSASRPRLGSDDDEEPDLPARINALDCPNADETLLEKPVTVRCALAPTLPVAKVFLIYRMPGKDEYTETEMAKTPKGWYQAKIPKKAVTGKSLQFYFEGRNASGKPVVANGAQSSPNIMLIVSEEAVEEEGGRRRSAEEEEENPLEERAGPYKPRLRLGRIDKAREGLDERFGRRKWWFGLGAGSGFGYAKGDGLEAASRSDDPNFRAYQDIFVPGGAWAGLGHLVPEVGYQINPNVAISLAGRLQWIPQPSEYSRFAARGALSGLAKVIFYTKQARLRFFGAALAGGGEGFRFVVYPAAGSGRPYENFKDTVRGGPAVAGLGGGLYYEAAKRVSLVLEVDGLAGLPTFSFVTDVNVGLQFNFY
jgi:hypothetical protein